MSARKRTTNRANVVAIASVAAMAVAVSGCGDRSNAIAIDGSSTVFPFAQAATEMYGEVESGAQITVGESGTGGGFEKFCAGETDISNASRPIKPEEIELCRKNGIEPKEVVVALDGLAVVTNPQLKVDCLTTDELRQLWRRDSKVTALDQINPDLPATELSLFGPGTDSGTFDYFTETINGEEGDSRTDFQPSEDDNVLVEGVAGDEGGLGFFGYSYYEENADRLNLVAVDSGDGCVKPTTETIQSGKYRPLSRPLFFYVSDKGLERPAVAGFTDYAVKNNATIARAVKLVPMSPQDTAKSQAALAGADAGATQ